MQKMEHLGECQFCKPRFVGDAGWYSSAKADIRGVFCGESVGKIRLKGELYLTTGKDDVPFVGAHFFPEKTDDGTLANADGLFSVLQAFKYCPYCGRRLNNAQGD